MTDKQPNPQSDNLKPDEPKQPAESTTPSSQSEGGTPVVKPPESPSSASQPGAKPEDAKSATSTASEPKPTQAAPAAESTESKAEKPSVSPSSAPPAKTAADEHVSTNKIPHDVVSTVLNRPPEVAPKPTSEAAPPAKTEDKTEPTKPTSGIMPLAKEADKAAAPKPTSEIVPPTKAADTTVPTKPTPGSQICPNCSHNNRAGVIFCENCGTNLVTGKQPELGTRDLVKEESSHETRVLDTNESQAVKSAGSGVFTDDMVLRIEIEGGLSPMLVYPKVEIIFGRRDPSSGNQPDVDLTNYAGYRMGVSRRHAALRLHDNRLDVSDLGSSNGTFLNGQRLGAHQPYQVRDGDEIRLGQMVLKLYFQASKS
ncbi:MAG: FHA domain-containing protein [Anaerolineaceae bacterium]|nr:FHA domain-containing protein [Anaerolineaceae bacterium]